MADKRPPVFISHSQEDKEGQLFIHHLLAREGAEFRPVFYSADKPRAPHADPIRLAIREARAVWVLLSPPMVERSHTRAWVGYEVGIACERGIPVVVIEPATTPVDLPVPGATVYLQRPALIGDATGQEWVELIRTGGKLEPYKWEEPETEKWGDKILTFLGNAALSSGDSTGAFYNVRCDFEGCRAGFFASASLHRSKRHPCPSCRREVVHWLLRFREETEKLLQASQARGALSYPPPGKALPPPERASDR